MKLIIIVLLFFDKGDCSYLCDGIDIEPPEHEYTHVPLIRDSSRLNNIILTDDILYVTFYDDLRQDPIVACFDK